MIMKASVILLLRSIVLRSIVLRSIVLRSIVLRAIVLRSMQSRVVYSSLAAFCTRCIRTSNDRGQEEDKMRDSIIDICSTEGLSLVSVGQLLPMQVQMPIQWRAFFHTALCY